MAVEKEFGDVDKWWDECVSHCAHEILAADDPQFLRLGYHCYDCDEHYLVKLSRIKALPSNHPLRPLMRTAASRQRAIRDWAVGCVLVREEV